MDLLRTLMAGAASERRAQTSGLSRPAGWLVDLFNGGEDTYSGKTVTPDASMRLVPVFSAVSLLAGAVGSTPLIVYRRLDEGRERATNHRTWSLLHEQPNEYMAADEFWEIVTAHVLLWGNGFVAKGRGADGLVNELVPLCPKSTQVWQDRNGKPVYVYTDRKGVQHTGGADEVLHFRGLSLDGLVGLSPIQQARQAIGNTMALEEFQGRFWANNARPGGVLKHPNELSEKAEKRLRASWQAIQGGLANAGRTAILEEGMEWQALGLPLADAQFIEQHKFSRSEIALLFRIPPRMLATDSGGSMTYANSETESLDFVKWSLRRWLVRHEGTLKRDPDLFLQGSRFYPEFLVDALLRADSLTRSTFYQRALDPVRGWLDVDEVRELENRNPLTDEQHVRRAELAAKQPTTTLNVTHGNGGENDGGSDPQEGDQGQ